MKALAVFLLAALLAGFVWFVSTGTDDVPQGLAIENEVEAADPAEPTELGELPVAENDEGISDASDREVVVEEARKDAAEEEAVEAPAPVNFFTGKVAIREKSGDLREGLSGSLRMVVWKDKRGDRVEVDIHSGVFQHDVGDAESVSISGVTLVGHGTLIVETTERFQPSDKDVVILVSHPMTLLLSVVDEETGGHLSEVIVTRSPGWRSDELKHPGRVSEANTVLTNGVSPIDLLPHEDDIKRKDAKYYVNSPGYAWQPVLLNHRGWRGAGGSACSERRSRYPNRRRTREACSAALSAPPYRAEWPALSTALRLRQGEH